MSEAASLVRAVLGPACGSDAEALALLEEAMLLEVEPLDFFAHRFGLGQDRVLERIAAWGGMRWAQAVPHTSGGMCPVARLDVIGTVRAVRVTHPDGDTIYVAPSFYILNELRAAVARNGLRRQVCLVPGAAIRTYLADGLADDLTDNARQWLTRRWPFASANLDLSLLARLWFVAGLVALLSILVLAPMIVPIAGELLLALIVLPLALLRLHAVWTRPRHHPEAPQLDDADLPAYTVLIPLRDEAHMLGQIGSAMSALDYPPEKLDIKLVVEGGSEATVAAALELCEDPRFELVVVPDSAPRTKPKALNYALPLARGEMVVVFDAEDVPEPDQLRRAAALFVADPGLDCVQAELVIENASDNWLTASFAGEYAGQFGLVLPALSALGLPTPLGGTSNHFRTAALRAVGAWDAFNVTEDADLGVRLSRLRHSTATLQARTYEEAPVRVGIWMAQRTRWLKGWMQTLIVHNAHPSRFLADIGLRRFLAFQLYVGGMVLSAPLHTLFAIAMLIKVMAGQPLLPDLRDAGGLLQLGVLAFGYGAAFMASIVGLLRIRQYRALVWQAMLPIYWLLQSIAAIKAALQLLTRPYFWAKTPHGGTMGHSESTRFARVQTSKAAA